MEASRGKEPNKEEFSIKNENSHFVESNIGCNQVNISNDKRTIIYQYGNERTSVNTKELFSELQKKLKSTASLAAMEMTLPIELDRPINQVALEISSNVQQERLETFGHYHRREDFMHMYKMPLGNVSLDQLFHLAENNARLEANHKYKIPEAAEQHKMKYGNVVGIVGQAGIGKTTLTKILTKHILEKALLAIDYLIYIPFRAVDFSAKSNLLQFLLRSSSCDWNYRKETDEIILQELDRSPNVILILDGLDEAIMQSISEPTPAVTLYDVASAEHFIKNILSGKLLPKAKKFVTSRPRQLYNLHLDHRPHFIAVVLGLSKISQNELCKEICGEDAYVQVIEYLDEHPNISAYCYVPVNCILTMYCIHKSLEEGDVINLGSITSVLAYALTGFVRSDHVRGGPFKPDKLAHLAWNGFKIQQVIFDEDDLLDAEINEGTLHAFLHTYVDSNIKLKILDGDKRSYFSHLIWQEFFAAVELMLFMDLEEFLKNASNFNEGRWEVVLRFLFGLCNRVSFNRLRRMLRCRDERQSKKEILKDFALRSMPRIIQVSSITRFLRVCGWAFESNDEEITKQLAFAMPEEIKLTGMLLSSDVISLNYLLRACTKHIFIKVGCAQNVHEVNFASDSFDRFFVEMHKTLQLCKNIKLKTVNVRNSRTTDQGLEELGGCLKYSTNLTLRLEKISSSQVKSLTSAIGKLAEPIKEFRLEALKIEDDVAKAISSCLHRMEILSLTSCEIRDKGIHILTSAINSLMTPMNELILNSSKPKLSEQAIIDIASCLGNVESLSVYGCKVTAPGAEAIATAVNSLPHSMKHLNLGSNKFGERGAAAVSTCIENVDSLNIGFCGISLSGLKLISEGILRRNEPMEHLSIRALKLGDEGMEMVSSFLHRTKSLSLSACKISASGMKTLSRGISRLSIPMECLDLRQNNVGDEGAIEIAHCLHNIGDINLHGCAITSIGIQSISTAISRLNNPMKRIDLHANDIGNKGAILLSSCLRNIERLSLHSCGVTLPGVTAIISEIRALETPMKELDMTANKIGEEAAIEFSSCLHNVEILNISECNINPPGIEGLSQAAYDLEVPIVIGLEKQPNW